MKFGFFIQATYVNWSGGIDEGVKPMDGIPLVTRVIEKVKRLAQKIPGEKWLGIVAPDEPQGRKFFTQLCKEQNIEVFFGSNDNVLERLLACCDKFQIGGFARINGSYWYLNEPLFEQMYASFNPVNCDLLRVPRNFPMGFAGEFSSSAALRKLSDIAQANNLGAISAPTARMQLYPESFRIIDFLDLPQISKEEVDKIRAGRLQYEPERIEFDRSKMNDYASIDYKRYVKALEYLKPTDVVLDIACGEGFGVELLAKTCRKVVGADYNKNTIAECQSLYNRPNLSFEFQDVTKMTFPDGQFDAVTSMETIEHVDEDAYCREVARVLKPGGLLIVSTPQNDWGFTLVPWHVKEYSAQGLRDLLTKKFDIVKIHGVTSHEILDNSEVGDRMIVVARRR